jgi:hypothetical protein
MFKAEEFSPDHFDQIAISDDETFRYFYVWHIFLCFETCYYFYIRYVCSVMGHFLTFAHGIFFTVFYETFPNIFYKGDVFSVMKHFTAFTYGLFILL